MRAGLAIALAIAYFAIPCSVLADPWKDTFELTASTDSLNNGRAPWSQAYATATQRARAGGPVYFEQWSAQNEYGLHDSSLMAGTSLHATTHTLFGLQLGTSASHNVTPSFDGTVSVEQRFGAGYGIALAFERKNYTTVNASIASITADHYFGRFYVAYQPLFAQLAQTPGVAVTHKVVVTRYDDRGGNLTVSAYAGRDVESTGPTSVSVMEVSGLYLSGHQMISPALAVAYGVETFAQGNLYSGAGGKVGLRYAF